MDIQNEAVRGWIGRIMGLSRHIGLRVENVHIPSYFISHEGMRLEVPQDPRDIFKIKHPDMGVTCTFEFDDINETEAQFMSIFNYFSSLDHVDNVLGLVNKELKTLQDENKELIECHICYTERKSIPDDLLHKFGSKTFVEKQFRKYEDEKELLHARSKLAMGLVDTTSSDALKLNVSINRGYGYPIYIRQEETMFGRYGITDDDLPF